MPNRLGTSFYVGKVRLSQVIACLQDAAACQILLLNNGLALLLRFLLGVDATASLFCADRPSRGMYITSLALFSVVELV